MSREEFEKWAAGVKYRLITYTDSDNFIHEDTQKAFVAFEAGYQAGQASRATLEPSQSTPESVEQIASILLYSNKVKSVAGAAGIIQSHVDQQTRELRSLLAECADDLEDSIKAEYPHREDHDDTMRRFNRDMGIVHRVRAALSNNIQEPLTGAEKKEEGCTN